MRGSEHYKKLKEIEDHIREKIDKTHFKPKKIDLYRMKYQDQFTKSKMKEDKLDKILKYKVKFY